MAAQAENEATVNGADEGSEAQKPKKKRLGGLKKKLVLLVVVLIAAGGATKFVLFKGGDAEAKADKVVEGEIVDVGTIVVNLDGSTTRYARVGLAIVAAEGASAEAILARVALLKDAAISKIASYPSEKLQTAKGHQQLRSALSKSARRIYADGEVVRVVLTELVIQ